MSTYQKALPNRVEFNLNIFHFAEAEVSYGGRAEGTGFRKGIVAGMRPRVLLTRPERAFSAHMKATGSCVFAWCLSRDPPCRRRRFRRSQPQGAPAARGDTVQGTKLLLQHRGTDKEEEGSPFTTSHSEVSSFSSITLPFQLGVLPQGTSRNVSRSEYC